MQKRLQRPAAEAEAELQEQHNQCFGNQQVLQLLSWQMFFTYIGDVHWRKTVCLTGLFCSQQEIQSWQNSKHVMLMVKP